MDPAAIVVASGDDVVDGRAEPPRLLEAEPELDALHDVDAHDRRGQRGIEPAIPVDVRPEPDRQAMGDDLEDATDRVAVRARLVDAGDHRGLGGGVRTAQRRRVGLLARPRAVRRVDRHAADLGGERPDLDPHLAQERARDGTRRDPGRRLAGARALEHVADVVEAVLERTGQVGVPGPDAGHGCRPLVAAVGELGELARLVLGQRCDLHHLRPVLPVAVAHEQQDRRAEGHAVADAAEDLGAVLFDLLARAPPVPLLAAGEVGGDGVLGQREAGRHALDRDAEGRSMRLARP